MEKKFGIGKNWNMSPKGTYWINFLPDSGN